MGCGCNLVEIQNFEIPKIINKFTSEIENLDCIGEDIQLLKENVICQFLDILDNLECGRKKDLEILLEELSLIEVYEEY